MHRLLPRGYCSYFLKFITFLFNSVQRTQFLRFSDYYLTDSESDEEEVVKNKDGFTEEEQITALEGLSPKELAAVYKALTTVSPDAGFNVLEYLKRYYVGEADLVEMLDGLGGHFEYFIRI